jgi:hypothetical protein
LVDIVRVVVPDSDCVPGQLVKARQSAQRIEVVIEDSDVHGIALLLGWFYRINHKPVTG